MSSTSSPISIILLSGIIGEINISESDTVIDIKRAIIPLLQNYDVKQYNDVQPTHLTLMVPDKGDFTVLDKDNDPVDHYIDVTSTEEIFVSLSQIKINATLMIQQDDEEPESSGSIILSPNQTIVEVKDAIRTYFMTQPHNRVSNAIIQFRSQPNNMDIEFISMEIYNDNELEEWIETAHLEHSGNSNKIEMYTRGKSNVVIYIRLYEVYNNNNNESKGGRRNRTRRVKNMRKGAKRSIRQKKRKLSRRR